MIDGRNDFPVPDEDDQAEQSRGLSWMTDEERENAEDAELSRYPKDFELYKSEHDKLMLKIRAVHNFRK